MGAAHAGSDGGYTQHDVVDVARGFTGWTVFEPSSPRRVPASFPPCTIAARRPFSDVPAGRGEADGSTVIGILARHPSTARFISRKLAQRFVADHPPRALVDRMAATFVKTDGDLRAVMETLLRSPEFLSEGACRAKLKSPFEMVVSSRRALDADRSPSRAVARRITELGQPLYRKEEPTGYSDTGDAWTSTAGLLGRMNFATALVTGQIAGTKVDADAMASLGVRRAMTEITGVEPSAEDEWPRWRGRTARRRRQVSWFPCSSHLPIFRRGSHGHSTLVPSHVRPLARRIRRRTHVAAAWSSPGPSEAQGARSDLSAGRG